MSGEVITSMYLRCNCPASGLYFHNDLQRELRAKATMSFVSHSGYRFGPFVLSLDRMCLRQGETDIELRPKAFDVLRHLVAQAGRVVSKDELVATVWPDVIVNDDALAQCIRDSPAAVRPCCARIALGISIRSWRVPMPLGITRATSGSAAILSRRSSA
jgi:hypothetical protein